jgi:hypothetical protein
MVQHTALNAFSTPDHNAFSFIHPPDPTHAMQPREGAVANSFNKV